MGSLTGVLQIGTLDLSAYLDVQAGQGMDPAAPTFSERVFSHSLLKEGGVLALENLKLREMIFPLKLHSNSGRSGVAQLIEQINQALATPGQTVSWKDQGAANTTTFDLASGQFDVEYDFRKAGNYWVEGKLRLFTQPFGRTASSRLAASAAGTGPLITLPVTPTPIQGDVAALIVAQVNIGSQIASAGRQLGVAVLPTGPYTPLWGASVFTEPIVFVPTGFAQASYIYWANDPGNAIGRANLDGTGATNALVTASDPWGLTVTPSFIYWGNRGGNVVGRANLDGTGATQALVTGGNDVRGMCVTASFIYLGNAASAAIGRANLDGTGATQTLVGGATAPSRMPVSVSPSFIYWGSFDKNWVGRANLDGTGATTIVTTATQCSGVFVSPSFIYYANITGPIGRANLDGTGATNALDTGVGNLGMLAVSASYIYWGNEGNNTLGRANLDGTGATQIVTPATQPYGVSVGVGATPLATQLAAPVGGSGAYASQYMRVHSGLPVANLQLNGTNVLPYSGDSRLLAVARAPAGGTVYLQARDQFGNVNATAPLAATDWSLVDLGVLRVPSALGASQQINWQINSLAGGATSDLTAVLVLPDNQTVFINDATSGIASYAPQDMYTFDAIGRTIVRTANGGSVALQELSAQQRGTIPPVPVQAQTLAVFEMPTAGGPANDLLSASVQVRERTRFDFG